MNENIYSEHAFLAISAAEHLPDLICSFKPDTTLVYANSAYLNFFNQTSQDMISRPWLDFVPEEFHEGILEHIARLSKSAPSLSYEHEVILPDGSQTWQYWTDVGEFDEKGNLILIHSIGRNVTPLHKATRAVEEKNEELLQLNRLFRLVIDSVPSRIWLKDGQNGIITLNKTAAESMGGDVEDFEGKNTFDLFGDIAGKYLEDDLAVFEHGEPIYGIIEEYEPMHGEKGWVSTDKIPFGIELAPADRRILVVATDISETMRMNVRLEESNRSLDQFASMASHDLKAPLRRIMTGTQMMQLTMEDGPDTPIGLHFDQVLKDCAEMRDLIEAFMTFTRSTPATLDLKPVKIAGLIDQTLKNADMEHMTEAVCRDDSIDELTVLGQADLVLRVLTNIISNAVKYQSSDRSLKIHFTTNEESGGMVCLSVLDNGIGVPLSQHESIFDFFTRGKNVGNAGGSGLGLAICKRIMTTMGGDIRYSAGKDHGSRFDLLFRNGAVQ